MDIQIKKCKRLLKIPLLFLFLIISCDMNKDIGATGEIIYQQTEGYRSIKLNDKKRKVNKFSIRPKHPDVGFPENARMHYFEWVPEMEKFLFVWEDIRKEHRKNVNNKNKVNGYVLGFCTKDGQEVSIYKEFLSDHVIKPHVSPDAKYLSLLTLPKNQIIDDHKILDLKIFSINKKELIVEKENLIIFRDSNYSWGPRSDRFVYSNSNGEITIFNWRSNEFNKIATGSSPTWHPKKDVVVYNSEKNSSNGDLVIHNINKDQKEEITKFLNPKRFHFSKNGRYLLFLDEDVSYTSKLPYRLLILNVITKSYSIIRKQFLPAGNITWKY